MLIYWWREKTIKGGEIFKIEYIPSIVARKTDNLGDINLFCLQWLSLGDIIGNKDFNRLKLFKDMQQHWRNEGKRLRTCKKRLNHSSDMVPFHQFKFKQ